jgi:hypothetical protein
MALPPVVHCLSGAPYDVYVGRRNTRVPAGKPGADGRWGNPFPLTTGTTREAVLQRYRHWLLTTPEGQRTFDAARRDLRGKTLACWCAPQPCHGNILHDVAAAASVNAAEVVVTSEDADDNSTSDLASKYPNLAARHPHALDGTVVFREACRPRYLLRAGGAPCVSCTEFGDSLFPFDRDGVAERCAARSRTGKSAEDFKREWQEAATSGTSLHDLIAHYYDSDGEIAPWLRALPEVQHFVRFEAEVRHKDGWRPYRVEWRIVHAALRLAGTPDAVFQLPDGNFVLVDWKRCKQIRRESWCPGETGAPGTPGERYPDCNASKFEAQLRLYAHILKDAYGLSVREALVVRLHPNAPTYEIMRVQLDAESTALLVDHRARQLAA